MTSAAAVYKMRGRKPLTRKAHIMMVIEDIGCKKVGRKLGMPLRTTEAAVLRAMIGFIDEERIGPDMVMWASRASVAERVPCSEDTVRRTVKKLVAKRWLIEEIASRGGMRLNGKGEFAGITSRYRLGEVPRAELQARLAGQLNAGPLASTLATCREVPSQTATEYPRNLQGDLTESKLTESSYQGKEQKTKGPRVCAKSDADAAPRVVSFIGGDHCLPSKMEEALMSRWERKYPGLHHPAEPTREEHDWHKSFSWTLGWENLGWVWSWLSGNAQDLPSPNKWAQVNLKPATVVRQFEAYLQNADSNIVAMKHSIFYFASHVVRAMGEPVRREFSNRWFATFGSQYQWLPSEFSLADWLGSACERPSELGEPMDRFFASRRRGFVDRGYSFTSFTEKVDQLDDSHYHDDDWDDHPDAGRDDLDDDTDEGADGGGDE